MKALVTGASGFIGSHLLEALVDRGDTVMAFVRREKSISRDIRGAVRIIEGDIGDAASVNAATQGCEVIFHLAVALRPESSAEDTDAMRTDAKGMKNICDAAIAAGVKKILFASTSAVYGTAHQEDDVTEDVPVSPVTAYAQSKRENELKLFDLWKEYGLGSVSMRFFNIYGPQQDARMVIPRFLACAKKGEALTINGDGTQVRDFVFAHDAVRAIVLLAEKSTGAEIVNVASGKETSVNDLATMIKTITNSSSEIIHQQLPPERKGIDVMRRVGSTATLQTITGYRPETTLEEGLRALSV